MPARRRALPRRALAGAALRAPARREERADRRRPAPPRRARRLRPRAGRARRAAMALPQQARVLIRGARRPPGARLPPPRQLGGRDRRRGLPAGVGAQQRGAQPGPRVGAARGDLRLRPAPQTGVLRNLVVREGRRTGQVQTRLVTAPASFAKPPSTCTPWSRGPAAGPTGRPACSARSSSPRSLAGLRVSSLPSAFFQTNTEMAERLYEIAAGYAGLSGRERVFDLYCGIGTIGLALAAPSRRGLGHRDRAPRRSPTPRRTPGATGSPTRVSSPPTCALEFGRCSSGRAVRTWSSSTRPAPGSPRR